MSSIYHPRPYQQFATDMIIKKKALALMLDMGLGKTVITLTAINDLMYDYLEISKVLVIAPLRVADTTWPDECKVWEHLQHLRVAKILGDVTNRKKALSENADIYVINREQVSWLVGIYGSKWPFDMVVIDESSSFKSSKSKRFKDLRKVRPFMKRIVELTGTPAPNGLLDLWSQIYLLDMGERLGKTISEYRRRYYTPGRGNGMVTYEWNLNEGDDEVIFKKIEDICVSMKSEDYLTLPEVVYNVIPVKLKAKELKLYKQLEKDMVIDLQGQELVALSAGALSNKLLQMANGQVYTDEHKVLQIHKAKIEAMYDIIEANEHKNLLVMYWFNHDLDQLKGAFPYARVLKDSQDIRDWNEGRIRMLLMHPASAGHGINLQRGGHIVVWFGLTWSLELYQQANKRLHRSGQAKNVFIHHLVAQGTIDEEVMSALSSKDAGQRKMLQAIKARIEKYANK